MTIAITAIGSQSLYNGNNSGVTPASQIVLSGSPTASQITFSVSGTPNTATFIGNFDLTGYNSGVTNLAQFLSLPNFANSTVTMILESVKGVLGHTETYSGVTVASWISVNGINSQPSVAQLSQYYTGIQTYTSGTGVNTASGGDFVDGYSGAATYYENHTTGQYSDIFIGGTKGINTLVLPGTASAYTTVATTNGIWDTLTQKNDLSGYFVKQGSVLVGISNVQRINYGDGSALAFDIGPTQNAGSVYMLYQAAFKRTPDAVGLGYWINAVDGGANITTVVAQNFINSGEFISKYGANLSIADFVNSLYQNVLGRAGDPGGVNYWNQQLNAGTVTKAYALEQFATLGEGATLVAPTIANGIHYTQWVG